MRIQTNTAANSALGYMRVNNQATERSIQKLSSGFRINRAADDAAGLAIANKLRSTSRASARRSATSRRATRCCR
jgi:flagellin